MTHPGLAAAPLGRVRQRIGIGDMTPVETAARLGMDLAHFLAALPALAQRGFPQADATTGNFGLEAVDCWRKLRDRHLFPELTAAHGSSQPLPFEERRARFLNGQKRQKSGNPLSG